MRLLSNASSGMRHYFAPRFALQNNAAPLRNALESNLIPALGVCTPDTVLKHVLGLIYIWWLGFAEPLYGEAGAKAPASLTFLLD